MLPRAERITEFVGILYAALSVGGREPAGEHFIVVFGFYGRRGYVVIFGVNLELLLSTPSAYTV